MTRRNVLGASLALASCSRPGEALSFWAMGYEGDYAPLLMPAFTAATGFAVRTQSVPWTAAHEKLLTAFAGGALPDVLMLPDGWVGEFAMIGALAPVADATLFAGLVPGAAAAAARRGAAARYAVPWSLGPQAQFYRRDILADAGYEAPPTRWEEWRRMGRAIKRRRPDGFAYLMLLNWWDTLFTFLAEGDAPLLREHDTRGNFRSPAGREALGFYASLFDEGLAPRIASNELDDPVGAFAQGYFAVFPYGPTLLPELHRRAAEIAPALWGTERMPGPDGPAGVTAVSGSLAVGAHSRRPADAQRLLAHLLSAPCELRLQRLIGNLPANRTAWTDPALANPVLRPFAAQVAAPAHDPAIPEWERIRIEVQLVSERVVRGGLTVEAALAEMDNRADRILALRRQLVQAGKIG